MMEKNGEKEYHICCSKPTLGAESFAGRKFRDFRVFFGIFAKVSVKAKSKPRFRESFAREIIESSRLEKIFSIQSFRFFRLLLCCFLITPIFSLLGYETL